MRNQVNIRSKGEIVEYVKGLVTQGQVKECSHLRLDAVAAGWFDTICEIQYASEVPANNVVTNSTGYGGPSSYTWPRCPKNCPHFQACDDFAVSMSRDQYDDMAQRAREANEEEPVQVVPVRKAVTYPDKVTLEWLWRHVPVGFWLTLGAAFVFVFGLGTQVVRLQIVKEWMGLDQKTIVAAPAPTTVSMPPAATTKK